MLLAGDIGGTKTRLAAYADPAPFLAPGGPPLQAVAEQTFASAAYPSLDAMVSQFVAAHHLTVSQAGFGVAGPVQHERAVITNLPWVVDGPALARQLALARVAVINDLEATAYGLALLRPDQVAVLQAGAADASGNQAVIAAGTGLGEGALYWDGRQHRPFPTEGGHADLAPRTDLEIDLLNYLRARFGHVSYERVLSGPGLVNVYQFLRDTGRGEEPAWLATELAAGDPAAAISRAALAGEAPLCERALDLFVTLYGAEAGNLALKIMATGGVFVGGGIAPKILPKLRDPAFLDAFLDKGRLRPVLTAMSVRVVLDDKIALLGAARCSALRAAEGAGAH